MSEEHKARTREMIKVMQAYVDGEQILSKTTTGEKWGLCFNPSWDFRFADYRIATTPDSIDWGHVAPEWKYMARDYYGAVSFYEIHPVLKQYGWVPNSGKGVRVYGFASYKRGTVDWKDSLVERPET